MSSPVRVGDVRQAGKQWGRRPTSRRSSCPACGRFVTSGSTACPCGTTFEFISAQLAVVTSIGTR